MLQKISSFTRQHMHREIDTFNGDLNARGTMEQPLRVITFCVIFNNLTEIL